MPQCGCLSIYFVGKSLCFLNLHNSLLLHVASLQSLFLQILIFQSHSLSEILMTQRLVLFLQQRFFQAVFTLLFRFAKFYRSGLKFSGFIFCHIKSTTDPIQSVFKSLLFFSSVISTCVFGLIFFKILYFFISFKRTCNCFKHFTDGCFSTPVR